MTAGSRIGTIMVLDDEEDDQFLHRRIIDRSGLVDRVVSCFTVDDALAHLRTGNRIDVILLDIRMPGRDGFDFLASASAEFGPSFAPVVVMLTTSLNPDDRERALSYPVVQRFVNKPLTVELVAEIAQLVDKPPPVT